MRLTQAAIRRNSKRVSHTELIKAFRNSSARSLNLQFLDGEFVVANQLLWDEIIKKNPIDKYKYWSNVADCDNFAAGFASIVGLKRGVNSAALVCDTSSGHAYNLLFVLQKNGEIKVRGFEPQSDRFIRFGSGMYKARSGFVMLF